MLKNYLKLIDEILSYIQAQFPEKKKVPSFEPPPLPPKPVEKKVEPLPPPPKPFQKKKKEPISLHVPKEPPLPSFSKMQQLIRELSPDLYLHEAPLLDVKAKRIKEAWKAQSEIPAIPILYLGKSHISFLHNLAKALSHTFASSRIVDIASFEKEKKWDLFLKSPELKLIVAPDHLLFSSKELLTFYKENPQKKMRYLGDVPLLLLPDLSLYFKDPYLKRSLWNVLCQTLKTL